MTINIGFMQGRLSAPVNGLIQAFPFENWKEEFKSSSEIGIHLMEWTLDSDDLMKNPLLSERGRNKIIELKKRYNLSIQSLTGDCFMQKPFWKSELSEKNILNHQFISICNACNNLGIKIIVIPIVDNGSLENSKQEDGLIYFLLEKYLFLKSLDLKIAFESDYKPEKLLSFISRFPSDQFGINYDTGNSAAMGFNSVEEFDAYGHRIINVHIKDRLLGGETVPLRQGNTDFDRIFLQLSKHNYSGNLILQTARAINGNHSEVIKIYFEMVSELIDKYISHEEI